MRTALVFGATGFIGRWLVRELASQGAQVVAAVRTSGAELQEWPSGVKLVKVDFAASDLGLDEAALAGVTEIHNLAGAYRFGMSKQEAYDGNVVTARRIVELAARLPLRPRLVHVSGYRVGSHDSLPDDAYRRLGAYEASKIEADGVVKQTAAALAVPFTIVNPSTVSGHSATGESEQQLGLAASLRELWNGELVALPRNAFVPVVTVDHLARFMALVATLDEADGQSYWVLDDNTPPLRELLQLVARHYDVPVPRLAVPVSVIQRLPRKLTQVDPETISLLDNSRYPTAAADSLAERHGLAQPETVPALLRWADHLAAHRFGAVRPGHQTRQFLNVAGTRTFSIGDPEADTVVLPPLPLNADTWATPGMQVVDLPGTGMSSGDESTWLTWLTALLQDRPDVHLIGHSVGAALAVEYAATHKVGRLTLVAPAFLQPRPGLLNRSALVTALWFRHAGAAAMARRLLGNESSDLTLAAQDLRRPGVARRAGRLIRRGADPARRTTLKRALSNYPGDVHVIVGEHDPLVPDSLPGNVRVTVIDGAGHYPQLTHPTQLHEALQAVRLG